MYICLGILVFCTAIIVHVYVLDWYVNILEMNVCTFPEDQFYRGEIQDLKYFTNLLSQRSVGFYNFHGIISAHVFWSLGAHSNHAYGVYIFI